MKALLSMLKDAAIEWIADKAPRTSAALAFYTLFSLAPVGVIAVAIAGFFFGPSAARNEIFLRLKTMMGERSAELVQQAVLSAHTARGGTASVLLGIFILIIGASGLFSQLQDAMNAIWSVRPKPGQAVWTFIRQRLLSVAIVLAIGAVLLLSLVLTTALTAVSKQFGHMVPGGLHIALILDMLVNLVVLWFLLAAVYKVLPDVKIHWRDVWTGAAVTAILLIIGRIGITLYLSFATVVSAYGAAGSLVMILVWVYFSAMIFFFGAEFTQQYAHHCGRTIVPLSYAEIIPKNE